jgi:hypothetical protein
MGHTPALLYTLGLLAFGLALTRFFPCTKCYKKVIVGTSTQPYFVSCTHQQVRCYIGSYTPRLARLLVSDTKSPRVKKTMQTTFVIKSRAMGLILGAGLILPWLVPLALWSIRTIMEATIKRKMATHVMMLWKYKPLDEDDAFWL